MDDDAEAGTTLAAPLIHPRGYPDVHESLPESSHGSESGASSHREPSPDRRPDSAPPTPGPAPSRVARNLLRSSDEHPVLDHPDTNGAVERLSTAVRAIFDAAARRIRPLARSAEGPAISSSAERVGRRTTAGPPTAEHLALLDMPAWVAELAHDIRSPLTSMLLLIQSLRDHQSGSLNEVQERQIALLYGAVFNLSSIANDVVEMSRVGRCRLIGPEPVAYSMREVLRCVEEIVLPITQERGIALHVVVPTADLRIGHPLALSRIFLNLTVNALRFTKEGSVEVSVRELGGNFLECAVTDTGPGIPPALKAVLSEPGHTQPVGAGYGLTSAGLGLAICRQLVTALGSELRVESRQGVGSRFWFLLDSAPAPER